ncbi:unnamed protein product, partial [marine sediment metagenome]
LEVSLTTGGELTEAVAEVMSRFAPNGVAIESTQVAVDAEGDSNHFMGPLRTSCYLPVDDQLEDTRGRLEEALWYLGRIHPLPSLQFRSVKDADWAEAWKEHYHPIPVGRKLIIVPAWLKVPGGERIPIRMDPGMAFGTGTHPSTQLCLEMIDDVSGSNIIDIGCGSGILSVAALKLGAKKALCVDIDPVAVRSARENAVLNGVAERMEVEMGSVTEIQSGSFTIKQAQLVLANILAPVLVRLLNEGLGELVTHGGRLILGWYYL